MKLQEGNHWYSISKDLHPSKSLKPVINYENIYIWIHMQFVCRFDQYTSLFSYEIFSPALVPLTLNEGNFSCISLSDICKPMGCGNLYTIKYTITDKFNIPRTEYSSNQQIKGIIEIIKYLRILSKYEAWYQYDLRQS